MIEVPVASLFMLSLATFILGLFAMDFILKTAVRVLGCRIIYERGCKKCKLASGVYIIRNAECIHCIFKDADRQAASMEKTERLWRDDDER